MKLQRLRIENFKLFRAPLEIDGFTDGLNLFAAPNESGKSTVAEAIRAAFFERHRSSAVEHLRPWGESSATPTVEVDFELDGKPCRLTKAFLGKKRCELVIDGKSMDGAVAEDHLAALLGFRFPGKGASTPEHMGIPGLLWIKQGTSHDIASAVGFASDHLRNALGESLGELASSNGDAVLKAVESERNELLTPAAGTPRGAFADAIRLRTELEADIERLRADIESYQSGVDRLSGLRRDHQRDEAARPWTALREQLAIARQRLDEAKGLNDRKTAQDAALRQVTAQVNSWRTQLQAMEREEATVVLREKNLQAAQEGLAKALGELQAWEPRHAAAAKADAGARDNLRLARQAASRIAQEKTVESLAEQLEALAQSHEKAKGEQDKVTRLQAEAQALAVPEGELKRLQRCADAHRTAQARLDAVATALEFELQPTARVQVAGTELSGSKRQTVIARTDIEIEGVGRITVLPGGADLESLAIERDRARDELAGLLQALRAESVAAVEERMRLQALRKGEAGAAMAVLAALAPKGLSALAADIAMREARLAEARQVLQGMPPADAAMPSSAQAESEEGAARAALETASVALNDAKVAAGNAREQVKAAEDELAAVKATLNDPKRANRKTEAGAALTDALAQQSALQDKVAELAQQLQSANLPVLAQDVERLEQSVKQAEATHSQRANEITRLEAELEARGALGQEEAASEKQRELEHATRRCAELERRAKALDHLLKLLREKRSALARRLRAPLQKHLDHYLQILFPGAQVEVGDDLSPGRITRQGLRGAQSGAFEELSVGAREQMGVVARLAYADLLKEARKPTLLILDDALVNTDEERLRQMKRVLYDAATRHQILIFSCHPEAWRDLGVVARSIP
ncbi:DNA repair exonuclease SbcCD ATPase subunit [Variovorax boronicumulans]|uniref:AAA family ATPase n=1 Tax=Variovorax boronicumulans TaxID=436515 RepID=UPI0027852012|nr:AAA family ATPase [Variovorax boronicumulans]MDQ0080677.1 DNA repair exonuclease SbcCD ATPase subunit [Variovorax boronicumulans]